MTYGPKPKSRDEDAVTFLPIDRSGAATPLFGPTDPRAAKAVGGTRIGRGAVFVLDDNMGRLESSLVAQACDNVVRGQETYSSLLYLGRARVEDAQVLFAASQSHEIKVRWERLWVLSPYMARLARHDEGRKEILAAFQDDLAGVHLLSKFVEQNNHAVKRLWTRLHVPLLRFLLARLVEYREDPRRAALLAGIVGTLETKEDALREALPQDIDEAIGGEILSFLYIRYPSGFGSRLSSAVLRDKLQQWRRE